MLKSYIQAILQVFTVVMITWAMLAVMFFIQTEPEQAVAEPIASIEVIEHIPEPPQPEPELQYIGEFTMTGYTDNEICCGKAGQPTASGTVPTEGRTIGTDWTTLPAGTEVYIEGYGYYIVEDKVAGWIAKRYDGKIIDLFMADYQSALGIGKQKVKVFIIKGGD